MPLPNLSIAVGGDDLLFRDWNVTELGLGKGSGRVDLHVDRRLFLRVETGIDAKNFQVFKDLDSADPLPIHRPGVSRPTRPEDHYRTRRPIVGGRSEVYSVSSEATVIGLFIGPREVWRGPLILAPEGVNVVRL